MDNTFDKMYYTESPLVGGIDESGVSDIAGPLVAACVVLPQIDLHKDDLRIFEIDDCKKIPEKYRKRHAEIIFQAAIGIGIGEVQPSEIDYLGRIEAIKLAMYRAVAACRSPAKGKAIKPGLLLIDKVERMWLPVDINQKTLQGGDTKSLCIAAASIVAKVYRDDIMLRLHERFPHYDWISNKGYPCENHYKGLDSHGVQIGIHRIKRWPFKKNPKCPEEDQKSWDRRRVQWQKITAKALHLEASETLWTTRQQS